MKPGLYWGKLKHNGEWELVEARSTSPEDPGVDLFTMGWDCLESLDNYSKFVPTNLTDPDGKPYIRTVR